MRRKCWLQLLVCVVLLNIGSAIADDGFYVIAGGGGVGTKISSLPYTINASGFYYVTGNLTCASGNGISVSSDDVTIDLMGFRISGNTSSSGIYMEGRKNVEIRNGTLKGWNYGIYDNNGQNHRVINVRAENNVVGGICLYGYNHLVRGCAVADCTGDAAYGIFAQLNCTVSGNQINNCNYTGIASYGGTISNNVLNNCGSYGIHGYGTISGNTVSNSSTGWGIGISCTAAGNVLGNLVYTNSSGQYGIGLTSASEPIVMDQNTVSGAGTHYSGGSAAVVWGVNNAGR